MATITYKSDDGEQEIMIRLSDHADVDDFVEAIRKLFLGIGYHPNNWPLEEE